MKWTDDNYKTYRTLVLPNIRANTFDANIYYFYSEFLNISDSFLEVYVANRMMGYELTYNDIVETVNANLQDYIKFANYARTKELPVCTFFSLYGYKASITKGDGFKEAKVWFDELGERTEFLFLTN